MDLSRLIHIALNNKKTILWFAASTALVVFMIGLLLSKYEVNSTILIKPLTDDIFSEISKPSIGIVSAKHKDIVVSHGNTYIQILESRNLIKKVVKRLSLDKDFSKKFANSLFENLKQPLRFILYGRLPAVDRSSEDKAVKETKAALTIYFIIGSNVLNINVKHENPHKAASIANTLVDVFIDFIKKKNIDSAKATRKFIEQQLIAVRSELRRYRITLNELKNKHELFIFTDFSVEKARILSKLNSLDDNYENNINRIAALENKLLDIKKEKKKYPEFEKSSRTLGINQNLKDFQKKLFDLKIKLQLKLIDYAPKNLQVISIKNQIASLEQKISSELKHILTKEEFTINPIYKNLLLQEFTDKNELKVISFMNLQIMEQIKKHRYKLINFEKISEEINEINLNIKKLENEEDELLTDLNRTKLIEAHGLKQIQVLDRAYPTRYPVIRGAALLTFVFIAIISGLIFGAGISILKTQLQDIIVDENDLLEESNFSPIKIVPISLVKTKRLYNSQPFKTKEEFNNVAIRFFSGIFNNSAEKKCLCITSARSNEGKTFVAVNFALALASFFKRVVIVDCHHIRPKIQDILGIPMEKGLSNYLENFSVSMIDSLVKTTDFYKLSVITYGNATSEVSQLFFSKEFNFLLKELKNRFEYIILDCPSIIESAELLSIATNSEINGVMMVIKANQTRKIDFLKAQSYIESVKTNTIALICNGI